MKISHINSLAAGTLFIVVAIPTSAMTLSLSKQDNRSHSSNRMAETDISHNSTISLSQYLSRLISLIKTESSSLSLSGKDLNNSPANLETIVYKQQNSTLNVCAQAQQLSSSYCAGPENANKTANATFNATQLATRGVEHMNNTWKSIRLPAKETAETNNTLEQRKHDNKETGSALHAIRNVAEQTNLPVQNAAIEAAARKSSSQNEKTPITA